MSYTSFKASKFISGLSKLFYPLSLKIEIVLITIKWGKIIYNTKIFKNFIILRFQQL